MKKARFHHLDAYLLLITVSCLCAWCTPSQGEQVTWQILPFPDSNWPGPFGQPATTNGNLITLQGQPVRTLQTFSGPLRISYDVVLAFRPTGFGDDGSLQFFFLPPGETPTQSSPNVGLYMQFWNFRPDGLSIATNNIDTVWGVVPFSISAQTVYHVTIDVSEIGGLTWTIDNLTNSIPSTVVVPYSQFQLQIQGWQPGDTWQVSNFAVVPEPSTVALTSAGLLGLLVVIRRRRSL